MEQKERQQNNKYFQKWEKTADTTRVNRFKIKKLVLANLLEQEFLLIFQYEPVNLITILKVEFLIQENQKELFFALVHY